MWLFTDRGFMSAVVDKGAKNPDILIIRGRDRESLRDLSMFASAKIIDNEGTDYPYRVRIHRSVWKRYVMKQIDELDYTNYKSAAGKKRNHTFTGALSKVWSTMLALEPRKSWQSGYQSFGGGYGYGTGAGKDYPAKPDKPIAPGSAVMVGVTPAYPGQGTITAPSRNHDPVGKRGSKRNKRTKGGKRRGQIFGRNVYEPDDIEPTLAELLEIEQEHAGYLSSLLDDEPPVDDVEQVTMPKRWWDDVASPESVSLERR